MGARIKEPVRTVETACFLRYCLLSTTDQLLLMVQRRIADIARNAASAVSEPVSWARRYKTLLAELTVLVAPSAPITPQSSPDAVAIDLRAQIVAIIEAQTKLKPPSRTVELNTRAPYFRATFAMTPGSYKEVREFLADSWLAVEEIRQRPTVMRLMALQYITPRCLRWQECLPKAGQRLALKAGLRAG